MYEINTSPTADGHVSRHKTVQRPVEISPHTVVNYCFLSAICICDYADILLGYRLLSLQSNMRRRRKPKSASLKVRFRSTLSIVLSVELSSVDMGKTLAEAVRGYCSVPLAVLDPRVGHTMDVLSPFISAVLCHSD